MISCQTYDNILKFNKPVWFWLASCSKLNGVRSSAFGRNRRDSLGDAIFSIHFADGARKMPKKVDMEVFSAALALREIKMISKYRGMNWGGSFQCAKGHGWLATPGNVFHKKKGCPTCSGNARLTVEIVNIRLREMKSSLRLCSSYTNNITATSFVCIQCRRTRSLVPAAVLAGHGCAYCSGNARLTAAVLNERLADRGIRVRQPLRNARTPTLFGCRHGHLWRATPDNVLRRTGCPTCSRPGFDPNLPAILYYLQFRMDPAKYVYKIGVTNRSVRGRFSAREWPNVSVLYERLFKIGREALQAEQRVKREYRDYRWTGGKLLNCGGDTELFSENVFAESAGRYNPF